MVSAEGTPAIVADKGERLLLPTELTIHRVKITEEFEKTPSLSI
jgi:hypothetical protein